MKNFKSNFFFGYRRIKVIIFIFILNFSYAAESSDGSNPILVLDPGLFIWTILSFLLLMVLLTKFAWNPLLKVLNEREEKIRSSLEKAEEAEKKLETLNLKGEEILRNAKAESQKLLSSSKELAQNLKKEIELEAKEKSASIINQSRKQIKAERDEVIGEIKSELSSLSILIAEKLLKKNISSQENFKLIDESIEKVTKINEA